MNVWGDECLKIGRGWWMSEVMNVGVMNVGQSAATSTHPPIHSMLMRLNLNMILKVDRNKKMYIVCQLPAHPAALALFVPSHSFNCHFWSHVCWNNWYCDQGEWSLTRCRRPKNCRRSPLSPLRISRSGESENLEILRISSWDLCFSLLS